MAPRNLLSSVLLFLTVGLAFGRAPENKRTCNTQPKPPSATLNAIPSALPSAISSATPNAPPSAIPSAPSVSNQTNAGAIAGFPESAFLAVTIEVGSPPKTYKVAVDIRSGITWLNNDSFVPTESTVDVGENFTDNFGSFERSGPAFNDTVILPGNISVTQQTIGVDPKATVLDGVLGLDFLTQAVGIVDQQPSTKVPTVLDNAFMQNSIPIELFGLYTPPLSLRLAPGGENIEAGLTFGQLDPSKMTSPVFTTPNLDSIEWAFQSALFYKNQTIFDGNLITQLVSAFPFIFLPSEIYASFLNATGAVALSNGMTVMSNQTFSLLETITFDVLGVALRLNPNAMKLSPLFASAINLPVQNDQVYLSVISSTRSLSADPTMYLGTAFLERYYVVFNATGPSLGFATSSHWGDDNLN